MIIPGFTTSQGFCAETNGTWTNYQCNTYPGGSGSVHVSSSFGGGAADLALQSVTVTQVNPVPGGSISIRTVATNIGTATSPSYTISYYASTDTQITSGDFLIGTTNSIAGLPTGQTATIDATGNLPGNLPSGTYYMGAILNISDANSANNVGHDSTPITVGTINYTITTSSSPSNGGTTSGGGTFAAGSSRTVTAAANSGYAFSNWTENGSVVSASASYTFTLNSNRNLVANFTTGPNPPTVQTLAASSVTSTSAVINGTVTNNGGAPVDHYYFYYWIDPNFQTGINDSGITVSGNSFSAQIVGLSPGTPYQFRAFAHNSSTVNLGFGVGWGAGSIVSFSTGSTGSTAAKPDFNSDGNADIIWQNNSTGQHTIWLMNGTSYMASADLFTAPLAWQIATTGDFNNDGKVDVYWQNTQTGQITIQLMNGTTTMGWVDFTFPTAWKIVGTGDFNGDSKTDILWENTQNGQVTIWLLNGTTTVGWVDLFFNVPLTWKIVGTGDFNGDGKVDILWQNAQTGQRTIQLMNGTVTMGWADPIYCAKHCMADSWRE